MSSQQSNPATLRELVRRWNEVASKIANRPTSTPETRAQATGWKQCADELEAALAASGTEAAPSDEHTFYSRGTMQELNKQMAAASPEGEGRTIQEVLRLHVRSSESMRETFQRTGYRISEVMQSGVTEGLKRAIEVADNMAALRQSAAPSAGAALLRRWRDHHSCSGESRCALCVDTDAALAQESKTGAAPSPSLLRTPQRGDNHGDRITSAEAWAAYKLAIDDAVSICEFAARGTIEAMTSNKSETWKIIAENSVEQYRSVVKNILAKAALRLGDAVAKNDETPLVRPVETGAVTETK